MNIEITSKVRNIFMFRDSNFVWLMRKPSIGNGESLHFKNKGSREMEPESFNSLFIKSFSSGDTVDGLADLPMVYHYTSPESFLSIIRNKCIRFSDIRYMNDKSETTFLIKRIIEYIETEKLKYPMFCEAVNALLDKNDYNKIKCNQLDKILFREFPGLKMQEQRNFIFCASKDSDSLNMWNYYVSNGNYKGYNIGFSVKKLLKTFDTTDEKLVDPFLVYYGNVIYDNKRQNDEIDHLASQIEEFLLHNNSSNKFTIPRAAISIQNYIVTKGPFFKDPSFRSENEYRILISIADKRIPRDEIGFQNCSGMNNREIKEDFYSKNGLLVPFLKVLIPKDAISRVTMSPMIEFEIAKSSIKELFQIYGFKNDKTNGEVPVYKSRIPVRF